MEHPALSLRTLAGIARGAAPRRAAHFAVAVIAVDRATAPPCVTTLGVFYGVGAVVVVRQVLGVALAPAGWHTVDVRHLLTETGPA